jgi:hypothetical protein
LVLKTVYGCLPSLAARVPIRILPVSAPSRDVPWISILYRLRAGAYRAVRFEKPLCSPPPSAPRCRKSDDIRDAQNSALLQR